MKKFSIAFVLLVYSLGYSQDYEKLRKSDEIYVLFENTAGQEKKPQLNIKRQTVGEYYYFNTNNGKIGYVLFSHAFLNGDKKLFRKRFAKDEYQQVVKFSFLKKLSLGELNKIFQGKKIYLIEEGDKSGKEFNARPVRIQTSELLEM